MKKKNARIIILFICLGLFLAVILFLGIRYLFYRNSDDYKYAQDIEMYNIVTNELVEITGASDFFDNSIEERKEMVEKSLKKLAEQKALDKDSIYYDDDSRSYTFSFCNGALGSVELEKMSDETFGIDDEIKSAIELEYEAKLNYDGTVYLLNKPDFGNVEYPYEERNINALFLCDDDRIDDDIENTMSGDEGALKWTSSFLKTEYREGVGVEELRTVLSKKKYNYIAIAAHGMKQIFYLKKELIYKPVIVVPEDYSEDLLTFGSSYGQDTRLGHPFIWNRLNDKEKSFCEDVFTRRIGIGVSHGSKAFYVFPEFISHYYKDKLNDSIIMLFLCHGYPDDNSDLVKSFSDCGAKAVLGYSDSVDKTYAIAMNDALLYSLLYGGSVKEALQFAKRKWGEDNEDYYKKYWNGIDAYCSAELKLYNEDLVGNERMVNLTYEVEEYLKKKYPQIINEKSGDLLEEGTQEAACFSKVLDQYKAAIRDSFSKIDYGGKYDYDIEGLNDELDSDPYGVYVSRGILSTIYFLKSYNNNEKYDICYSIQDINGDGDNELLIGIGYEGVEGDYGVQLAEIFIQGTEPIKLKPGSEPERLMPDSSDYLATHDYLIIGENNDVDYGYTDCYRNIYNDHTFEVVTHSGIYNDEDNTFYGISINDRTDVLGQYGNRPLTEETPEEYNFYGWCSYYITEPNSEGKLSERYATMDEVQEYTDRMTSSGIMPIDWKKLDENTEYGGGESIKYKIRRRGEEATEEGTEENNDNNTGESTKEDNLDDNPISEEETSLEKRELSEDEAYAIAYEHWNFTPGDIASDTGFQLSVYLNDTMEKDGVKYYYFIFRWLVTDENGNNEHWSSIDNIYINSMTGECVYQP